MKLFYPRALRKKFTKQPAVSRIRLIEQVTTLLLLYLSPEKSLQLQTLALKPVNVKLPIAFLSIKMSINIQRPFPQLERCANFSTDFWFSLTCTGFQVFNPQKNSYLMNAQVFGL